jgi:hypothetical protein
MKNLFLGTLLLALMLVCPLLTMAEISINIGIPLPPAIRISGPPRLVVLPETYVYVAPDVEEEIFFYDGWWWRPYGGGWYRSRDYSSGWRHYRNVPSFYHQVPRDWRNNYSEHHWQGHQWNVEPIAHDQVQTNWKHWKKVKHWETQNTWGVEDLRHQQYSREVQVVKQKHYNGNHGRGNHGNQGNHENQGNHGNRGEH